MAIKRLGLRIQPLLEEIFIKTKISEVESHIFKNEFLARLNNVQGELLYYPGVGVGVGVSIGVHKC